MGDEATSSCHAPLGEPLPQERGVNQEEERPVLGLHSRDDSPESPKEAGGSSQEGETPERVSPGEDSNPKEASPRSSPPGEESNEKMDPGDTTVHPSWEMEDLMANHNTHWQTYVEAQQRWDEQRFQVRVRVNLVVPPSPGPDVQEGTGRESASSPDVPRDNVEEETPTTPAEGDVSPRA